jgi:hypothetical protein
VVARLVQDHLMAVRMLVAGRPDLPEALQIQLAGDPSLAVQRALAANPNLCAGAALQLRAVDDNMLQRQLDITLQAEPELPAPARDVPAGPASLWDVLGRRPDGPTGLSHL